MESTVLTTKDLPRAERYDALRHTMETSSPIEVETRFDVNAETEPEMRAGAVGVLHVVAGRHGPGEARRTARHIRRSDPELYKVLQATDGTSVIDHNGRQTLLAPGDFTILDTSMPMRWTYSAGAICVGFPKSLFPLRGSLVAGMAAVGVPGNDGVGALAAGLIANLPRQLDGIGNGTASRLGSAVIDLISVAVAERVDRATAPPESHRQALLMRIHAFIEERLGDPDLSAATIAAAHHISIRYLHKLFVNEESSVGDWIRQRRLERCRADLLDPCTRTQPVSTVGAHWGYPNPSHFNRIFRERYGMPPGEFRRQA